VIFSIRQVQVELRQANPGPFPSSNASTD